MKKQIKNRLLALGLTLVVITGLAFGYSNYDLLKGTFRLDLETVTPFSGLGVDPTEPISISYNDNLNEYYLGLADAYSDQAQEYADSAEECLDGLGSYYGWTDSTDCSETDGGQDYYTKGTISGISWYDGTEVNEKEDYCIDEDFLAEFWCIDDTNSMFDNMVAGESYDCGDDYSCLDGACVPDTQNTCSETADCADNNICDNGTCIAIEEILTDPDYICEEPFYDTDDEMICRAYKAGIVKGKSYDFFDPYAGITRAEMIKIIVLIMGQTELETDQGMIDVYPEDWYWGFVNRAKEQGIITETAFNPNIEVTRGTTMVWLARAAEQTLEVEEWEDRIPWSDMTVDNPVTYAAIIANDTIVEFLDEGEMQVVTGYSDDTFRPENQILRYEAVYLAYRGYLAWFTSKQTFVDPDEL